jgi:hypothetical protein
VIRERPKLVWKFFLLRIASDRFGLLRINLGSTSEGSREEGLNHRGAEAQRAKEVFGTVIE